MRRSIWALVSLFLLGTNAAVRAADDYARGQRRLHHGDSRRHVGRL